MNNTSFNINVEEVDGVHVVALNGALDSASFPEYKETFSQIHKPRGVRILMDLANLTYINSTGLGHILQTHRYCMLNDGWFSVCTVPDKIRKNFELLGMGSQLRWFDSKEEALAEVPS